MSKKLRIGGTIGPDACYFSKLGVAGRLEVATLALLPHFSANATSQETCNKYSKAIRMDPAASVVVEDRDYAAPQAHSN